MKKNNLIRHHNKKTNVTYLYWGHSTYVPGQAYPRVEKKCIGKVTSEGIFVPNKTFLFLSPEEQMETALVEQPYPPLGAKKKETTTFAVGDVVSISDFNGGKAANIFASLQESGQKTVLRYNHPVGVLLSIDAYTELQEEAENYALLKMALQRMEKTKKTYSMQEVMESLGISEKSLEGTEED